MDKQLIKYAMGFLDRLPTQRKARHFNFLQSPGFLMNGEMI